MIQQVPVTELKPNERNPRYIRKKEFEKLKKSLKAKPHLLNLNPIKATPDGTIIAGNQRFRAALELGLKEVPVIYSEYSEEDNEYFSLLDNSHFGEWDSDILANEFEPIVLENLNIPFFFPEPPEKDEPKPLKLDNDVCELCGK